MAPTPQENVIGERPESSKPMSGEEVVISGISGVFPKSDNILEFMNNLYNKVDMVTDEDPRWVFNHPEVPKHLGKVNGMGKFDAQFFRVHYKQACTMEPMSRKLLEHAYSAIYDAGINPYQLRRRKVGVFIGSTFSESEKILIFETIQRNGLAITGCNKAMYANRISYWIDGKGPSYSLDLACASSMGCLEHAYRSISSGQCDAAIVGGCNLCMHPIVSLNLKRAGFLCLDGKTKCFDKNGDGYARSDAISVVFLQKAKHAKRIYSEVYYAKGNYSLRPDSEFLPIRLPEDIKEFLEAFYSEIDVSPKDVEYIEGCGSAIAEADGNELEAIGEIFAKEKPIMVGSVKSNMGHSEPASGVCSVAKVCLAYHTGIIPANLHYYDPQDHIPSVRDGKVRVLEEHAPFNRGFIALNSFSYSGANIHVLLKGHFKRKDPERYNCSIPRLVLASGRQESCVSKIFGILKSHPIDPEQIGLLNSIHEDDIPGHMCRGFIILDTNENKKTVSLCQNVDYSPGLARPVWFVYSGMGSQWPGMGAELMRIPIFAAAIEKCRKVLEPRGVDIVRILIEPDKTIFDNILHSFVGIAAVQIGLTDILKEMGIVPDNIIGHSVGELGCAYADGCFTAEEMILSAYSRGLVSVQTPFIRGSMAAIGMGYKTILPLCPPEVEVACHNSSESSTISGPADIMKKFVAELTAQGVFAKEVPCSNIAFHSRYIADGGPGLLNYLSEVIKDPKLRSEKWVSTSVSKDNWEDPVSKYSSAEYHTNNLLNPVLFEETSKLIPSNAIVIEIAPHGLLQAILKRSLSECIHVPLTRRGHSNPVKLLLESIGKLYQAGVNPKVDVVYPKIDYPVATETPMLSHFVEWVHSEDWPQAKYNTMNKVVAAVREFVMCIHDDDYEYFKGYVRDGAYVFPEAASLVLVWETLAMQKGLDYRNMSVEFRDVKFHGEASIRVEVPLRLGIMIHKGNNKFEVTYENTEIVSGFINVVKSSNIVFRDLDQTVDENDILLTTKDIYRIMHLRGLSYKGEFQSIHSTNVHCNKASIKWTDKWLTFLDALIQLNVLTREHDGVSIPKTIRKLTINTDEHKKMMVVNDDGTFIDAEFFSIYGITRCGGVEMNNIVFTNKPKTEQVPDVLLTRTFVPHFLTGDLDIETALQINFQIIADNIIENEVKITEFTTNTSHNITNIIKDVTEKIPSADFDVKSIQTVDENIDKITTDPAIGKSDVFVINNLLGDEKKMKKLYSVLSADTFILALEQDTTKIHPKYKLFNVIAAMSVRKQIFILLKKADTRKNDNVTYISIVNDNKFSWVPRLKTELQKSKRIVLISERQPHCGLMGLVKVLRRECANRISLVFVDDYHAPSFNPENNVFEEQLQKNLTFNVLKKGLWGGHYYITAAKTSDLENIKLISTISGDLDSLTWIEDTFLNVDNTSVQVHYAGPSYRDAQRAIGNISCDGTAFGMDFSGINIKGERVMGLLPGGSIASMVQADLDLIWPVPSHWSLEDAATVPMSYCFAYYCLTMKSTVNKGYTVFVSGGAGALGQAVISICLALNCTVFTTVSDIQKKKLLLRMFPALNENNIGNSRDNTFSSMVIHKTRNKRCDIVINCGSGSIREEAMKCVGHHGIFLDVTDNDMYGNNEFGMMFVMGEKNYIAVNFSSIFKPENMKERKALQIMIAEGIRKDVVRPISRVVYTPSEASKAFRLLSSSRHKGRVLLKMRDLRALSQDLKVIPRMTYSSKNTYVVVCGDDEFGIELIDRLVRRGASKLVVHVKPDAVTGYFCTKLASWRKAGVSIRLSSDNLKTEKGCVDLLKEGTKLAPIVGIFIVQDKAATDKRINEREIAMKFNGTSLVVANLDLMSRNVCTELNHFVVIVRSSQSSVHEYTTSSSERICQVRNGLGLPALLFRIESMHEFQSNHKPDNMQSKVQPQTVSAVSNALETSLKLKYNNVVTFNLKKRRDADFLRRLTRILGLKHIDDVNENLTLNNLIINKTNAEEIRTIIKEIYEINYPVQKIQNMSVASLKKLSLNISKQNAKFASGLGAFYTFIDKNEFMATEPMVAMPTILSNATEKEEELDTKATYLMLIPGFEGHHQIFKSVCERLKVQAMTFQLGPDLTNDSIQQMAANIMKFIKKRFELKSKFYLLGYSFGVNVVLELAALMEKEGHVGVVYCLDSSPDALRVQLDAYLGNLTDTQLQNAIVEHMYNLMTGQESVELKKDLIKCDEWPQKIEACVNRIRGLVKYSHQYKRSILQGAYRRIQMARDYEPDFKLESQLVLMKGIPHPKGEKLADDYGLSRYTKQPVKIFDIKTEHVSAPQDSRVSNIVNKFFDPQIIEEFRKKSLCETYSADPLKIL